VPEWNDYWFSGEGEITSYVLTQSRYGEERKGTAVLVFVTEPFSQSAQVKLDNPNSAVDDKVSVLKLNMTKSFPTGIYPYSLMQSVFTPVSINEFPHSLKTSMSGQEWCGQVFQQLNLRDNAYEISQYSYFQSEGDLKKKIDCVFLEDEIWTRLRIQPKSLPIGSFPMIPGSFYTRLMHEPVEPVMVTAKNEKISEKTSAYVVEHSEKERVLRIIYESTFPYRIIEWEEEFVHSPGGKRFTTTAKANKVLKLPYWQKNTNEDLYLRDSLHLPR
jgi:hypothetical protein